MAKNHYVSQLIIKRFAPSVSTFDMQTNQIVEHRQAAKIFFDRDIYDNDIEEKMAHDLEQPFASILDKKILNCEKIRFAYFIIMKKNPRQIFRSVGDLLYKSISLPSSTMVML